MRGLTSWQMCGMVCEAVLSSWMGEMVSRVDSGQLLVLWCRETALVDRLLVEVAMEEEEEEEEEEIWALEGKEGGLKAKRIYGYTAAPKAVVGV